MLKIIENGPKVSYVIGKIDLTTKIIDIDPIKGLNIDKIKYFGKVSPLNPSGDPPVSKL